MFKENDSMRPEPTPERVFALCRAVALFSTKTKKDLADMMEPNWLNENPDIFNHVLSVSEELDLVRNVDGALSCKVPKDILSDISLFRKFVADKAMKNTNSTFFLLTSWYLAQNEKVFEYASNAARFAEKLDGKLQQVDESAILGWRFWASFFGIGVRHKVLLIPNLFLRLKDALEADMHHSSPLPRGKDIPFSMFYSWLKDHCPESVFSSTEKSSLCLGLSNGLRFLHDRNMIQLFHRPDAREKWKLFPMVDHELRSDVSEIRIGA